MIFPTLPTTYSSNTSFSPIEEVDSDSKKERSYKSSNENIISGTSEKSQLDLGEKKEEDSGNLNHNTPLLADLPKTEKPSETTISSSFNDQEEQITFTKIYLKHNFSILISNLMELVDKWRNSGTEESIDEISEIKSLLEEHVTYFEQTPESRILLGGLETIFENDNWEKLDKNQLGIIYSQLEQFKAGNIKMSNLKNFSREIFSAKIL